MTAIKVLLIAGVVGVMLWAFRNRTTVGLRAGVRISIMGLAALAIASIINPNITQHAANMLGVTRGTDLVLYVLIVVFMATSLGMYFRFKELERRLAQIVRANAIRDAQTSKSEGKHQAFSSHEA